MMSVITKDICVLLHCGINVIIAAESTLGTVPGAEEHFKSESSPSGVVHSVTNGSANNFAETPSSINISLQNMAAVNLQQGLRLKKTVKLKVMNILSRDINAMSKISVAAYTTKVV